MKKVNYWLLVTSLPLILSGCGDVSSDEISSTPEEVKESVFEEDMYFKDPEVSNYYHSSVSEHSTSQDVIDFNFEEQYFDAINSLNNTNTTYAELYLNGERKENVSEGYAKNDDANYLFYGDGKVRVVSRAKGYSLTIPSTTIIEPNLQFNNYRTQYKSTDYVLTVSIENQNPYNNWKTYHDEWLTRYLTGEGYESWRIERFMTNNNLSYTRNPSKVTSYISGYEVELISICINDNENIEFPYYNFAIIRTPSSIKEFTLLVMKSKTEYTSQFDSIVKSYKYHRPYGIAKNCGKFDLKVPSYLSEETQKYYKHLMEQNYTEWGIFSHSMAASGGNDKKIKDKTEAFESVEQMDYKFGIAPTYTHCGKISDPGKFPLNSANTLAGGNGFNQKPVLQFTMQFTANNNETLNDYTPMYDILRGKYDNYFKDLAADMKAYGKPILFRLNNEMNSDWVSYCGAVTMIDPDIFAMTWERMARIFKEEGCDNILYIFNPTGKTYPYCNWGEDLCYLPSLEYVQIIGLTYYEYNNYFDQDPVSFFELYEWLYEKNSPYWVDYPAIISEFACGAGGNYPEGKLYRNSLSQAVWVEEMFDVLNYCREQFPFVDQIKGAVWFNANDEIGAKTKNLLILDNTNTKLTIEMFKLGLSGTKEFRGY